MEKIYLPTSSLNFNSILATESISPEYFYINRKFGYKSFRKVNPNPYVNSLICYNKIPIYDIINEDLDEYPLIIEISLDFIPENSIENILTNSEISIFRLKRTLYFHPIKVKFLFFTEEHKKIAILKTNPSIETKLLTVYTHSIELISKNYQSFKWNETILNGIKDYENDDFSKNLNYDTKLDKLKGFYFSYFLGLTLVETSNSLPLIVEFEKIIKSIQKSWSNKAYVNQLLDTELSELNKKIIAAEGPKQVSIEDYINFKYLEDLKIEEIKTFLSQFKKIENGQFIDQFNSQFYSKENSINHLIDNLIKSIKNDVSESRFEKKVQIILKYLPHLKKPKKNDLAFENLINNINLNGLSITQFSDSILNESENKIFKDIVNEIIDFPIYNEQDFKVEKVELAYKIGNALKDYFNHWESSLERDYFNGLMDNIESFQPFDIKSHNSILLQSIAVFILKGEDPEKLLSSLQKNNISDFRIAFGLWGCIFGFSALPKTLSDIMFHDKLINRTELLYNNIQSKIHNYSDKKINPIFSESIKLKENESIDLSSEKKGEKNSFEKKIFEKSNEISKPTDKNLPNCPKCGASMVLRKSEQVDFYGCSNFSNPSIKCKGTLSINYNQLNKYHSKN